VAGQSRVYGDARVSGNAFIHGQAHILGSARVSGSAQILDAAQISGDASVSGNVRIYGNARISGDARVYGDVQILGQALIESSQHWFSLTQGGETMSIYRSTRPGGFEINIEGQEVTIELLDEDLGRFVQRTIEANFDLAKKKGAQISALRR
jgi:UDP-3-O-[3-hydroxymyristoyl] glucosamine N-acyltransferase